METFPPLYKDNKEWRIEVVKKEDGCILRTEHGRCGGKKIVHERLVTVGKQGRTVLEQAIQEARSKHRLKMEKDLYSLTLSSSPGSESMLLSLSRCSFRPMLAQTFHPEKKITMSFPCFVQPKYDGIRAVCMMMDTMEKELRLYTRTGLLICTLNFPEIQEWMKEHPGVVLDGELWSPDLSFEVLSGLLRRKNLVGLPASVGYYVFDLFHGDHPTMSFRERQARLEGLYESTSFPICRVPTWDVSNVEEAIELHDRIVVEEDMEGIMLRDPDSVYRTSHRSQGLQKFKRFQDAEFEIVGFREAEGNDKGTVLWICKTCKSKEKTFSVRPRGTREARTKMLQDAPRMIGKPLTCLYQELSSDGIPRFPVGKGVRWE